MYLATDIVVLGVRALGFLAVFHAVGAAAFLLLFGRDAAASADRLRSSVKVAVLAALGLTALYHFLLPARMAGSFGGVLDDSLGEIVAQSNLGPAHAVRFVGLCMLLLSLDSSSRLHRALCWGGAGLALLSFALMGHTTFHALRLVLAPLLVVHVAGAAFWFGSLQPLHMVASREDPERRIRIIRGFSSYAVYLVPLLFACGVAMAVIFLQSLDQVFTAYGAMVVLKTVGFAAVLGLAILNRSRLTPAIATGNEASLRLFKRVLVAEWILLAGVLVATGVMTALFAPESLHASFGGAHDEAE